MGAGGRDAYLRPQRDRGKGAAVEGLDLPHAQAQEAGDRRVARGPRQGPDPLLDGPRRRVLFSRARAEQARQAHGSQGSGGGDDKNGNPTEWGGTVATLQPFIDEMRKGDFGR